MNHLIVAYENNRIIGNAGELPWQRDMPADLRHFRNLTTGHPVIMGRATFESIGRLLPNRQNIMVTRQLGFQAIEGLEIAHSLDEAYDIANDDSFVIGGGQLYRQAIETTDIIHATHIDMVGTGDVTFPSLDMNIWAEIDHLEFPADAQNAYDYSFITYKKLQ